MKISVVIAATATLLAAVSWAGAKVLQEWDFEDDKPLHNLVIQGEKPEIVADPLDPKNKVMRSVLKPDSKREERSEVMPGAIKIGEERWVGVRILRPNNVRSGFNCFFQLGPVDGAKGHEGGGLYQLDSYDGRKWKFRCFYERVGGKGLAADVGPINYGQWDVWVFHVKFRADKEGLIEVWRNGRQVLRQSGPNGFDGDQMRIKWGVYIGKGSKAPADISCLYDDITIGDEKSSYDEVVPKPPAVKKKLAEKAAGEKTPATKK